MDMRAVYKDLITLAATHLNNDMDDARGNAKFLIADSMAELLKSLRL